MSSEKIRSPLTPSRFLLYVLGAAVLVAGALGALWPT
jgi:hypothetical protein